MPINRIATSKTTRSHVEDMQKSAKKKISSSEKRVHVAKPHPEVRRTSTAVQTEDSYDKTCRENAEKRAKDLADKKQAEKDASKEKKRLEKVIVSYLDKLEMQINEKNLLSFWTFPDIKGFKKICNRYGYDKFSKFIQADLEKYKNRQVMQFHITFLQNESNTSLARKSGNWFTVSMMLYKIDSKGDLKNTSGCHYAWRNNDFKITKFSFKLLETIMYPIADHKHKCISILGIPLWNVIERLEQKGIDFTDVLKPLAKT